MKLLSICFTTTVNWTATSFKSYIMLTLFILSTLFDEDYTRIQEYEFTITHFTIQFHLKHFTNLSSLDIESKMLLLLTL